MPTNPYEAAWIAMGESHDCAMTGYLLSGSFDSAHCTVTVCETHQPCMELGRLYAEAYGYGPATFHRFPEGVLAGDG